MGGLSKISPHSGPYTIAPEMTIEAIQQYLTPLTNVLPGLIADAKQNVDRCFLGSVLKMAADTKNRVWGPSEMDILSDVLLEEIVDQSEHPEKGPIRCPVASGGVGRQVSTRRLRALGEEINRRLCQRWPLGYTPGPITALFNALPSLRKSSSSPMTTTVRFQRMSLSTLPPAHGKRLVLVACAGPPG